MFPAEVLSIVPRNLCDLTLQRLYVIYQTSANFYAGGQRRKGNCKALQPSHNARRAALLGYSVSPYSVNIAVESWVLASPSNYGTARA
jgi:hypothetical protein